MQFAQQYTNEYGITCNRYRTYDALYSSQESKYFGNKTTVGFLNATISGLITKGGFTPIYASRMFQAGVDPKLRNLTTCLNCPTVPEGLTLDELDITYGSFVDVNPDLGKSLRGQKQIQLNVELGQPWLWGGTRYAPIPAAFLPYLTYNMTVQLNQTQADIVNDGLNSLHMGLELRKGILIASVVLVFISGFLCVGLFFRWRTISHDAFDDDRSKEGLDNTNLQGNYVKLPS